MQSKEDSKNTPKKDDKVLPAIRARGPWNEPSESPFNQKREFGKMLGSRRREVIGKDESRGSDT